MSPARSACALFCAILLALGGCSGEVARVPVRVSHGPGDTPFEGATQLRLRLLRGGAVELERAMSPDGADFDLGVLDFGSDLRLELDVLAGEFVVARGGSFPFDVLAGAPVPRVDLHVGRLGRFVDAEVGALDAEPVALSATGNGALIATAAGTLYQYLAHAPADARPRLTLIGAHPELRGASFRALPDGGLLAVGGNIGRVRRYDATGALVAEHVDVALLDQRRGASLMGVAQTVWVVGGSALDFGGASSRLSRVDLDGDRGLSLTALPDLPCPVRDSPAALVSVASGASGVGRRLLVVCADALRESRVVAVDPSGVRDPQQLVVPGSALGASVASLGLGLALVAGGRDAEGMPTDVVRVLAVADASLSEIPAASRPLFAPRVGAAAQILAPGRVLLIGGRGRTLGPMATAEIVSFPGTVALTGPLPRPEPTPQAASLQDGSVLVADSAGAAVYVPAL